MPARTLDEWAAQLRETNPEVLTGTSPEHRTVARSRWHPAFLRVYGIHPWQIGRYTIKETNMLVDDLERHGLGF